MGANVGRDSKVQTLPRYVVEHGLTGYKYRRTVPTDIRDVIRERYWVKVLKSKTVPALEIEARSIAVEHDRLIETVRSMAADTRTYVTSVGSVEAATRIHQSRMTVRDGYEAMATVAVDKLHVTAPDVLDQNKAAQPKAILKALYGTLKRDAVLAPKAPKTPPRSKSGASGQTLGDLVGLWLKVTGDKHAGTISRREMSLRRFMDAVKLSPGDPVASVTRAQAKRWRDVLENAPTGRANLQSQLRGVAMLFKVAEDREWIEANPFLGLTLGASAGDDVDEDEDEPDKRSFTDDEARHVLGTLDKLTLATNGRTDPARLEEFKLIVRIVAHMGMRPGEVVQLRLEDVAEVDGVLCFAVRRAAGAIKNRWSRRDMPVHAALVDDVKTWVKRHSNGTRMFPAHYELKDPKAAFNRRSHDFIRLDCGIDDERVSLYSFRHRFRVLCRDVVAMPGHMVRFLMGHKPGTDISDNVYGATPPSVRERKPWLDRIQP